MLARSELTFVILRKFAAYMSSVPTSVSGSTPYPVSGAGPTYPPYPTAQGNTPMPPYSSYPLYPSVPTPNNVFSPPTTLSQQPMYPPYPASPAVPTSYPTPTSSNLPYPTYPSTQSSLVSSATSSPVIFPPNWFSRSPRRPPCFIR